MNTKIVKLFFFIFFPFLCLSLETDTIRPGLVLEDGDTVESSKQIFKLGFFTPDNTPNRYLGVFYAFSEKTVVWIANRDKPLNDSSSTVTISKDGNLVLINGRNQTVWSTNATTTSPTNTTLQIQDTGNLILLDDATGATIWESFLHPSDVFLPAMKISDNINTGKKVFLSAWKNETDPEVGSFTSGVEASKIPQIFVWNNGRPHWRSGPWNGSILMGIQDLYQPFLDGFGQIKNDSAGTFYFTMPDGDMSTRVSLDSSGILALLLWNDQQKIWYTPWAAPRNECDIYGRCGPFGSCSVKYSPVCSCLRGFEPADREEWERGNWSSGCRRKNQLQCGAGGTGDGFSRLQFMKFPDFAEPFYSREEGECRSRCLGNCSCIAYAHDSNIGCMFWSDTLIDVQKFDGVGPDFFIRLPASELDNHKDRKLYIIIPVVGFVSASVLIFVAWCFMVKRRKGGQKEDRTVREAGQILPSDSTAIVLKDESEKVNMEELPLFSFETLAYATNQFHQDNLLGQGGYGPVYKGILANGKEIAVKRLSATSGQGMEQFMNEVIVISKLQHRNLVKLLGCCVERDEKMLIYEYMPNRSLDVCLFDPVHPSQNVLNWMRRFNIIEGIGRGLLYLHRHSRLRIIHRDLKPSNVLLDEDWNPKISDFGMARIFGGNQDQANTARVVGTYGYMAPEYATEGRFSEKSDVYSFGVVMLEIIKGKKNTHYYNQEWSLGLLGCAWKLWSEDNGLGFADESMESIDLKEEIVRCIQIGLLCVQEFPEDRPTIKTVLSMLSREIVDLPPPEQPVFDEKWNGMTNGTTQPANQAGYSINDLTLTVLDGR